MRQQSLAAQSGFERHGKKTRREQFLEEMERVVPWAELEALIRPHYPTADKEQGQGPSQRDSHAAFWRPHRNSGSVTKSMVFN